MAQSARVVTETASAFTGTAARRDACIAGRRGSDERRSPGAEVVTASSLEGESVLDAHGNDFAEIEEVVLDVASGRIAHAVLAVGGFLGIGEKYFPVPWRALRLDADRKRFVLDMDKDKLAAAPSFDEDHWPSMADEQWIAELHRFYGVESY